MPVAPWLVRRGRRQRQPGDRGPRHGAGVGRGRRRAAAVPGPGAGRRARWRPSGGEFMADETGVFAAHRTRERADVIVDGTGGGRRSCVRRSDGVFWLTARAIPVHLDGAALRSGDRDCRCRRLAVTVGHRLPGHDPPQLPDRLLGAGPVRALDAHHRRRLAVGQVERDPRRAGRQVDRDDLRPLVLAPAVAVDHDQPVRVRLDPGPQQAVQQREGQQPEHQQGAALEQREPLPGLGVEGEPREHADDEQPGADRRCRRPAGPAGAR